MMRVLVADSHVLSRKGWKGLLADTGDLQVCGEAGSLEEILDKMRSDTPDLLIMDIELARHSLIDFLQELRRLHPDTPILVHTALPEADYGPRVLRAGASGFVHKTAPTEVLLSAVRKSVEGGRFVSDALAETLAFQLDSTSHQPSHEVLSNREYQVFCLIAGGKPVSQIAKELSLSVKTISTFRSRILAKLEMKNNADIMRYAMKQGLVD